MAIKLDEAKIRLLKISGGIEPTVNNSLSLGTNSYKWANVYATNYYGEAQTLAYGSAYPGGDTSKIWHEVATFSQKNTSQINTKLVLYVSNFYSTESSGILEITARQQASATTPDWVKLNFITASGGITLGDFVATWKYDGSTTTTTIKLYVKRSGWTSFNLTKIAEHSWGAIKNEWSLKKVSSTGITAIPTGETQVAATVSNNTFSGVYLINETITSNIRSQNVSFLHYSTTATSGHWFNKAVYVSGEIYAGSSYNQKVLHAGNYTDYTVTKTGSGASGTWDISIEGNAATATKASALTDITTTDAASSSDTWRRIWMGWANNTTGRPAYDDRFVIQTSTGTLKAPMFSGTLSGGIKDYNDGTLTKFGYSTSGMTQSAATWLGAWDATTSGEYRLRAVKQADLRVAYATSAGSATKATQDGSGNVITNKYVTLDTKQTISGAKTFSNTPVISNAKYYASFYLTPTLITGGELRSATIYSYVAGSSSDTSVNTSQVRIRQYSYTTGSTSMLSYYDQFSLPATAADKTANNSYTILTTKNKVSLAQGGTGVSLANAPASAIIRNSSDGSGLWYTATAAGAFYAESTNGLPKFGTLPVTYGGTGKTTGQAACNYFLNALSTGSSTPTDADYYISQYVGGGTTTTTYHRRPMSALWAYIQDKSDNRYVNTSGDTMTGQLTVPGFFYNSGDATLKFYASTNTTYGTESVSIQTAFDAVDGQTHEYVTGYESRCNLLLQPRGGQVYIGINHTAVGDTTNSLIVGGNAKITNLLTTGSGSSHYGVKVGNTYINAIDGNLILQNNSAIRFGGDSWDYNIWAGLKYVHSSKTISLGLADGSTFTANNAQSGGTLALPGIRYFSVNGKRVLDAGDTWLRINEGSAFSAGVYFGTSLVRTDGQLQVGSGGSAFYAKSDGTGYFKSNLKVDGKLIMTGNIAYTNGGNQYDVIKFVTGDANGAGLVLGGGGVVIIGSGESASNFQGSSGANIAGSTETTYITSDNGIEFYTNCQTIGNRVGVVLNASRYFYPNANNTGSLGTTSYKWGSGHFYGAVNAGAVWAAHPTGGESDIGVSFASGKNLYLYANNSSGGRGLYDSTKGTIISVTDSAASFNGNASSATVAATLGKSGTTSNPMKFYWSGQSGQPTWLWGGTDGTNMYVYNPSNFSVNYATSAGSASSATTATTANFLTNCYAYDGNSNYASYPWHKVASITTTSGYADFTITFLVTKGMEGTSGGILRARLRTNGSAVCESAQLYWLQASNLNASDFVGVYTNGSGSCTMEIWVKVTGQWEGKIFTVLSQSNRSNCGSHWTLSNTNGNGAASYTSGTSAFTSSMPVYTSGSGLYGAVWNDYAEYRAAETLEPGRVIRESADGIMKLTTERLLPGCEIVSDTFGFALGKTDECKTPIAATGRVLAYTLEDRDSFELGQAVCSGPNGTVSKMTREEIITYPERIIGTVSEIPTYDTWGTDNIAVDGRIWIRIK